MKPGRSAGGGFSRRVQDHFDDLVGGVGQEEQIDIVGGAPAGSRGPAVRAPSGQASIAALAASLYPPNVRATGVGWAYGAGRVASIFAPLRSVIRMPAGERAGCQFFSASGGRCFAQDAASSSVVAVAALRAALEDMADQLQDPAADEQRPGCPHQRRHAVGDRRSGHVHRHHVSQQQHADPAQHQHAIAERLERLHHRFELEVAMRHCIGQQRGQRRLQAFGLRAADDLDEQGVGAQCGKAAGAERPGLEVHNEAR